MCHVANVYVYMANGKWLYGKCVCAMANVYVPWHMCMCIWQMCVCIWHMCMCIRQIVIWQSCMFYCKCACVYGKCRGKCVAWQMCMCTWQMVIWRMCMCHGKCVRVYGKCVCAMSNMYVLWQMCMYIWQMSWQTCMCTRHMSTRVRVYLYRCHGKSLPYRYTFTYIHTLQTYIHTRTHTHTLPLQVQIIVPAQNHTLTRKYNQFSSITNNDEPHFLPYNSSFPHKDTHSHAPRTVFPQLQIMSNHSSSTTNTHTHTHTHSLTHTHQYTCKHAIYLPHSLTYTHTMVHQEVVCYSVLQCVAVCCSVLQCDAVWCDVLRCRVHKCSILSQRWFTRALCCLFQAPCVQFYIHSLLQPPCLSTPTYSMSNQCLHPILDQFI